MSKKKAKKQLSSASDVLQSLLQNSKSPLSEQFLRWRLWKYWSDVVGPTMAEYSDPVGYDRGCLYVWVSNSVQLQEMTFVVRPLITKINKYVGKVWVRRIRFTLDRKAVPLHSEMDQKSQSFISESAKAMNKRSKKP